MEKEPDIHVYCTDKDMTGCQTMSVTLYCHSHNHHETIRITLLLHFGGSSFKSQSHSTFQLLLLFLFINQAIVDLDKKISSYIPMQLSSVDNAAGH